jgi:hypothetical protein
VLPSLGEVTFVLFELLFEIGGGFAPLSNARSCLRSGGTKLAAVRSLPHGFAGQGHLVVDRPQG